MACTLLLLISNEHVTALWFDLIWLASYCITTQTRTLTLASYCCPTEAASYYPTNPTSPMPIRIRTDKPRTVLPCDPITRRADTPTTSITCHADIPMTRTRLGRACSLDTRTRRLHHTATLTCRQDLAPLRLRYEPDNPSCQYAYDPVAGTVLLPT